MACLDMFNNEQHQGLYSGPRISFSNDFVDTQRMIKHENRSSRPEGSSSSAAAASSDFEFSVSNYSMMAADELFSKGRLLPYKDNNCINKFQKMTLRDELNTDHNGDQDQAASPRPPKAGTSIRWKELLGLKRTRTVSKKGNKSTDGSMEKNVEPKGLSRLGQEDAYNNKSTTTTSQEVVTDGGGAYYGSGCRDVDEN